MQPAGLLSMLDRAIYGYLRDLKRFIRLGGDINALLYQSSTNSMAFRGEQKTGDDYVNRVPLLIAYCMMSRLQHISILIDAGVDVTAQVLDMTCLGIAALNGLISVMKLLIQRGLSVNAGTATPLDRASANNQLAAVQFLIDNGADVQYFNITESSEAVQLHIPLFSAACPGHLDVVKLLYSHGAPLTLAGEHSTTALHITIARKRDNVACMQWLCECTDLNQRDAQGDTPLHCAVEQDRVEALQLILQAGADINALNSSDLTALEVALNNNYTESVRFLVAQPGLRLTADMINQACSYAVTEGHTACFEALLTSPGYRALSKQHRTELEVQMLPYARDAATLHLVVQHAEDLQSMLQHVDEDGYSCLHMCAGLGSPAQMVCQLIKLGVDPTALTNDGETPAGLARSEDHTVLAQLLAELRRITEHKQEQAPILTRISALILDLPFCAAFRSQHTSTSQGSSMLLESAFLCLQFGGDCSV